MIDLIKKCIDKGALVFPNVSGGKDGQAMVKVLQLNSIPMAGLVHADLGRAEWNESLPMCETLADDFHLDLYIVKRSDGADMVDHWNRRMIQLMGKGIPFWSSSSARYCTSDLKRDPINKFYRAVESNFIISAEGIRAAESDKRAQKKPLEIRWKITSAYYRGMTTEEAIENYHPDHRLALTWFPIFTFTTEEVWETFGMSTALLNIARAIYKEENEVPAWWPFHPAYVYGNDRVSCVFCILGSLADLKTGAKHHPVLLGELISMEDESGFTFKKGFSLKQLIA